MRYDDDTLAIFVGRPATQRRADNQEGGGREVDRWGMERNDEMTRRSHTRTRKRTQKSTTPHKYPFVMAT